MRWLRRLTMGAVIAIAAALLVLLIRAKTPSTRAGGGFRTYAMFRDGSRLAVGSAVVIAGVQVGRITKLTVEGQLARVDMRLRDDLDLPVDSFATRRADSLFGDSYVEIIPAGGSDGGSGLARMKSGDPVTHVVEGSSADTILRGIATGLVKIDSAMDVAHGAMITSRKWVNGPLLEGTAATDRWIGEGRIEAPIESAARAMVRVDEATARGADAVARAVPEVAGTLDRIDGAIASARGKLRGARDGLAQALARTREGLDGIDPQIAQAREVMAAIDQGRGEDWKGTLGRQVNDPALADQLEDLGETGRDAVAGLDRFKSWLGMRVEYNVFSRDIRFYATAELHARNDKFYLAEFERSPLGGLPRDSLSDIASSRDYLRQQEIRDKLRFTAQFGKAFGPLALRGGIKDSTFGAGADALMLDGRLKLSVDVFGAFQTTPRIKIAGALAVFRSAYVLAGIDDALNPPSYLPVIVDRAPAPTTFDRLRQGRDYFVGTMLTFTDEDIAILLRVYSALLPALL